MCLTCHEVLGRSPPHHSHGPQLSPPGITNQGTTPLKLRQSVLCNHIWEHALGTELCIHAQDHPPPTYSPQPRRRRGEHPHSEDSPQKSSPARRHHSSPRHLTLVSDLIHFPALAAGASRTQAGTGCSLPLSPIPGTELSDTVLGTELSDTVRTHIHTGTHTETQSFWGEGSFPSRPPLAPCSRASQLWGRGWRGRLVCSE